jgi:hypothetical protein
MLALTDKPGVLLAALLLVGCPTGPDDDDSSAVDDDDTTAVDDDDTTEPPEPLAPVIGVFNLTNVVQGPGVSYVEFSGGFGEFAEMPDEVFAPASYLGLDYSLDAPFWRTDLGAWPLPALGEWQFIDLLTYYPWIAAELLWWDAGLRVGAGAYLCGQLDIDHVIAYQVDDPISPGAAAWTAGGAVTWENPGGLDVIDFIATDAIPLPDEVVMMQPTEGSEVQVPSALDYAIRWLPGDDGAFVTIGLLSIDDFAYIAHVPDTGEHVIPASVLHDDFGAGKLDLVVARNLQTPLAHPQGDILFRSREERRAIIDLLPDVVLDPPYAEAGEAVTVGLTWFTEDLSAGLEADFGEGIVVGAIVPDSSDVHRAEVSLQVQPEALPGGRDVVLTLPGGDPETLLAGFAVLNLLPSDDCASADAAAPLGPGQYWSTTVGLGNDQGIGVACLDWSLNGADAVYRVELEPNDTLLATLDEPLPGDGALYLLTSCGDGGSAVACADATFEGEVESLAYTSLGGGTYYLVVDAWSLGDLGFSAAWRLDLFIEQDVIDPDWIVPGSSRAFVLYGEAPWHAGILPADIDLGAGVAADAAAVGAVNTELEFLGTAAAGAVPGPRDITVSNGAAGPVAFEDALWVTGWPVWDSCAEASAAAAESPGTRTGFAVQTTSTIDDVPCLDYASVGPELMLPLELTAGAILDVAVTLPVEDAQLYILQDCALPESCFVDAVSDFTIEGEEELIVGWPVPETGRYYVVVDTYGGLLDPLHPWQFDLSISVQ